MLRICTHCNIEKEIEKFVRQGNKYRYKCKECLNKSLRTGKEHTGKFKKGNQSGKQFQKGHVGGKRFEKNRIPWNKGKINVYSDETLKKISESGIGRRHSFETKQRIAEKVRTGKSRISWAFKNWRNKVFIRDDFTCRTCGCKQKEKLHPHHITKWKDSEERRFDVENGITLCNSCHAKLEGFQLGEKRAKKVKTCQQQ